MEKTEYQGHQTWYKREVYRVKKRFIEKPDVDWRIYSPKTIDEWIEILTYMNILAGDPTLENQTAKMRIRLEKGGLLRRYHGWPYYLTNKAKFLYERAVSGDYPSMPTINGKDTPT